MEIARFDITTAGTKNSLRDMRTKINDHFQGLFASDECCSRTHLMHTTKTDGTMVGRKSERERKKKKKKVKRGREG